MPTLSSQELLEELVGRAREMGAAQDRLEALLRATQRIVGELDLDVVLQRVVEAACELVGAPYGALGIISPDGRALQQFVHVGISDQTVEKIGNLPEGKGLLGALIDDPRPIRLRDLSSDARSVGFPEGHPPMRAFLGAPVRLRDQVFGNLYLTREEDREFSASDQELVSALASTAGLVITSARLYEESNRRHQWLQASTAVTRELLTESGDALRLIAARVQSLAGADLVSVAVPVDAGSQIELAVAVGTGEVHLSGYRYPAAGTLAEHVLRTGEPVVVPDAVTLNSAGDSVVHIATVVPLGPVALVPLTGEGTARGILQVARVSGGTPFTSAEVEMLCEFAVHAELALEIADARAEAERMAMFAERTRIARDLHDHAIQQLFAAGMAVESVRASTAFNGPESERLDSVVVTIDDAIRQIRTAIFQLQPTATRESVRMAVLEAVAGAARALGFDARIEFIGPVDSITDTDLGRDVAAVVREALTNVARHARASAASVRVEADGGKVHVRVTDDGIGIPSAVRHSGLSNLRQRAENRGGTFTATPGPTGGTVLTWTASADRHATIVD